MPGSLGSTRFVVVMLCVGAVAAAAWWFLRSEQHVTPATPPSAPAPAVAPAPEAPELASAALPTPASTGIPEADCIAYPDGTKLPPLNGVKKAPAMTFHRLIPFTTVVRKQFDRATGLEWYIHANGARSTTRMQWRNGVQEAIAEIEMPSATAPADPK